MSRVKRISSSALWRIYFFRRCSIAKRLFPYSPIKRFESFFIRTLIRTVIPWNPSTASISSPNPIRSMKPRISFVSVCMSILVRRTIDFFFFLHDTVHNRVLDDTKNVEKCPVERESGGKRIRPPQNQKRKKIEHLLLH